MKIKAAITGVYTSSVDGVEYVTKNGNPYLKVLFVEDEGTKKIYEPFFMTLKAHFRAEQLFDAVNEPCPTFEEIGAENFKALIGQKLEIVVGTNKAGYDTIKKFVSIPKIVEPIEPVYDCLDRPQDLLDDDDDENDDIPF